MTTDVSVDDVLTFWFGTELDSREAIERVSGMWFKSTPDDDERIRQRFGDTIERAIAGELEHLASTPRGRLALIILLDQMPRNIFRGTARAFAGDARALAHARALAETGGDLSLHPIERTFAYTPFEHAEDLAMQDLSVEKFTELAAGDNGEHAELVSGYVPYATQHRDIVSRFGRFPHRNSLLGRASTAEEVAFLQDGGPTFGQGGQDNAS